MIQIELKNEVKTRFLIAKKGESLRTFSKKNGFSHTYLSQILNGKRNPSPIIANKIAKGLSLEVEDIFLIKVVDVSNKLTEAR